jgi:hypothetical protein
MIFVMKLDTGSFFSGMVGFGIVGLYFGIASFRITRLCSKIQGVPSGSEHLAIV